MALFLLRMEFNNGEGSLSIFIPLVFIGVLAFGAQRMMSPPNDLAAATNVFVTLAFGLSYILLWTEQDENSRGIITVMKALVIMAMTGVVSYITNADIRYSESLNDIVSMYIFGSLVIVASSTLSGMFSRQRFKMTSFAPRMVLWQILSSTVLVTIFVLVLTGMEGRIAVEAIPIALVTGAASGAILLVVTAPFTVLVFGNTFYRERFGAIIGHVPDMKGGAD